MPATDEPNTFLMPISLVRFCILSETSPTTPNKAIVTDNSTERNEALQN